MKYLTKALWSALQAPGDVGRAAAQRWDENLATYLAELSDAGDGFLPHEVLFASGSMVLVEFRDVSVERVDRPSRPTAT